MSLFSGFSDIFSISNLANIAVTTFTGNPMLGQLAGSIAGSLTGESGSGNLGFDQAFNQNFLPQFLDAVGG